MLRPLRETSLSSTGLPMKDERLLAQGWQEAAGAGYTLADVVALADWVKSGGMDWYASRPPWEYLCSSLFKCLQMAEAWRRTGCKPIEVSRRRGALPQPALAEQDDLLDLTDSPRSARRGIS